MTGPQTRSHLQRAGHAAWRGTLWLKRVILVATCALFTAIILVQIVFRYFLYLPLHGMEELATYLAIWTYFIGGAHGAFERSHISASLIEMLVKRARVTLAVRVLANGITVVVAVWMTLWAFDYLAWSLRLGPRSLELRMPLHWVHASMVVGLALMSFYFVIELMENARRLSRGGQAGRTP